MNVGANIYSATTTVSDYTGKLGETPEGCPLVLPNREGVSLWGKRVVSVV